MLSTRRLTVGSAPGQLLQIPDAGVDPEYAIVTASVLTGVRVVAATTRGIVVNGQRKKRATLTAGDVLSVGGARIVVRRSRSRKVVLLEIQEGDLSSASHSTTGPRMSRWSWGLAIGTAVLFLLVP